jgi:hypothetical protein
MQITNGPASTKEPTTALASRIGRPMHAQFAAMVAVGFAKHSAALDTDPDFTRGSKIPC